MPGIGCPSDTSAPTWRCPHDFAVGSYAPNYQVFGTNTINGNHPKYRIGNLPDGTSNVLFLAERFGLPAGGENDWVASVSNTGSQFAWESQEGPQVGIRVDQSDWKRPNSAHPGGMVAGLGDGSVRTISGRISQSTWWSACVPDDSAALGSDW